MRTHAITSAITRAVASTLTRRRAGGFGAAALLAGSTALVWLDPSDLTTLFQDAAGTTPVTAPGQPVGLALDKSQGLVLGPELVTSLNFSSWTNVVATTVQGVGTFTTSAVGGIRLAFLTVGRSYKVECVASTTATDIRLVNAAGGATPIIGVVGASISFSAVFTAADTSLYIRNSSAGVANVTTLSVRELPGFHATASGTSRPTYGVVPSRGRVNLLTRTEEFNDAAWNKANSTTTSNAGTAPDGLTTADLVVPTAVSSSHFTNQALSNLASGSPHQATVFVKAAGYSKVGIRENATTGAFATFDLSGSGSVIASGSGGSGSIFAAGDGWFRITLSSSTGSTLFNFAFFVMDNAYSSGSPSAYSYTGNGTSGILLWGAQLEVGSTASPYQRVASQFEVTDPVGFPTYQCHYLSFDGVDDFMVTPTITPGADKVQVFAGVRKLSDAATGMVAELGTDALNVAGSFAMFAPSASGANSYRVVSRGSLPTDAGDGVFAAAPNTSVLTGLGDISGDALTLRRNGVVVDASSSDQGTGNFLAYPLFIGRRGGTSLPANIQLFGLIVRFSTANLDAGLISQTERWVAQKTPGVTIA